MLWRRVQVERPRVSTSGGHSDVEGEDEGGAGTRRDEEKGAAADSVAFDLEVGFCIFVRAFHEATSVHVRHLERERDGKLNFSYSHRLGCSVTHGLPSLPNTTPLGRGFGEAVDGPASPSDEGGTIRLLIGSVMPVMIFYVQL